MCQTPLYEQAECGGMPTKYSLLPTRICSLEKKPISEEPITMQCNGRSDKG